MHRGYSLRRFLDPDSKKLKGYTRYRRYESLLMKRLQPVARKDSRTTLGDRLVRYPFLEKQSARNYQSGEYTLWRACH
jgi:hypothetical protein